MWQVSKAVVRMATLERQGVRLKAVGIYKSRKGSEEGPRFIPETLGQGLANRGLWARAGRLPIYFFKP